MKALVTGSNGFVGMALSARLAASGHAIVSAVRCASGLANEAVVGDIDGATDWATVLKGCDAVVHLAARVHVMDDTAQNPLALYRATNTAATSILPVRRPKLASDASCSSAPSRSTAKDAITPIAKAMRRRRTMPTQFPNGKPSVACIIIANHGTIIHNCSDD